MAETIPSAGDAKTFGISVRINGYVITHTKRTSGAEGRYPWWVSKNGRLANEYPSYAEAVKACKRGTVEEE